MISIWSAILGQREGGRSQSDVFGETAVYVWLLESHSFGDVMCFIYLFIYSIIKLIPFSSGDRG